MKWFCIVVTVAGLAAASVLSADAAVTVNVTYTADNIVGAMYQDGGSPVAVPLGSNANNWQAADTASLSFHENGSYQLVFLAENLGTASTSNPAAFLAEISGDASGDLLTSVDWDYAVYDDGDPTPGDFNALTWTPVTEYAANGEGVWDSVNNGPVAGISTSAQWIWDSTNTTGVAEKLWIRAQISTPSEGEPPVGGVPEPATLLIWSVLGLVGLAWRRCR